MGKTSSCVTGARTGPQSGSKYSDSENVMINFPQIEYIIHHKGVTRLREDDVGYLVEILATNAGKWRDIGIKLGFTPNELDSLPFSPKPADSLTFMLNEWTQWVIGGNHNKYAILEDLERALQSRMVNLGDIATELREKWMQAKGLF